MFHYGNLSLRSISNILTNDLLFQNKSINGFWLHRYLNQQRKISADVYSEFIEDLIKHPDIYISNINNIYSPEQFTEAFKEYKDNMSKGKILFKF